MNDRKERRIDIMNNYILNNESQFNTPFYKTKDLYWIEIPDYQIDNTNPYIIVLMHTESNNRKEVRVYLKYLMYADGIFTKNELNRFIEILNNNLFSDDVDQSVYVLSQIKYESMVRIKTVWKFILAYWNFLNPRYPIDINTPIPDYSKLDTV